MMFFSMNQKTQVIQSSQDILQKLLLQWRKEIFILSLKIFEQELKKEKKLLRFSMNKFKIIT